MDQLPRTVVALLEAIRLAENHRLRATVLEDDVGSLHRADDAHSAVRDLRRSRRSLVKLAVSLCPGPAAVDGRESRECPPMGRN
jgi:hypothetical protein